MGVFQKERAKGHEKEKRQKGIPTRNEFNLFDAAVTRRNVQ